MNLCELPDDCLLHIFNFLELPEILRLWRITECFSVAISRWITMNTIELLPNVSADQLVFKEFLDMHQHDIRSISYVNDCLDDSNCYLELFSRKWPNLKFFEFSHPQCAMSIDDLQNFFQVSRYINKLTIKGRFPVRTALIESKPLFPLNHQEELYAECNLPSEFLIGIISANRSLVKLSVWLEHVVVNDIFKTIAQNCVNLQVLTMQMHGFANQDASYHLTLGIMRKLHEVNFTGASKNMSLTLGSLQNLTILRLIDSICEGKYLTQLKNLKELCLHDSMGVETRHLIDILNVNSKLTKLELVNCGPYEILGGTEVAQQKLTQLIISAEYCHIFQADKLANLNELSIQNVNLDTIGRVKQFLTFLTRSENLQNLHIHGDEKFKDLPEIFMFPNLSVLSFGPYFARIDDETLIRISNTFRNLKKFGGFMTAVSENGLIRFIETAKAITNLNLDGFKIFDETLYRNIVDIRKSTGRANKCLTIRLNERDFIDSFVKTDVYYKLRNIVSLTSYKYFEYT